MKKLLLFLGLVFLAGCNNRGYSGHYSGDPDVSSSGSCTASFIKDYNDLSEQKRSLALSPSRDNVKLYLPKLVASCDSFFRNHSSSTTCMASRGGSPVLISTYSVKSECDQTNVALNDFNNQPAPEPIPLKVNPTDPDDQNE